MGTFFIEEGTPIYEAVKSSRENLKLAYEVLQDVRKELEENPDLIRRGKEPNSESNTHCIVIDDVIVYLTGKEGEVCFRAEIGNIIQIISEHEWEEELFFYSVLLEPEDEEKFIEKGKELYDFIESFDNKPPLPGKGMTDKGGV